MLSKLGGREFNFLRISKLSAFQLEGVGGGFNSFGKYPKFGSFFKVSLSDIMRLRLSDALPPPPSLKGKTG